MTLDASQSRLYVAQDNADQVAVIDTSTNRVDREDRCARARPACCRGRKYTGAATSAVTLSPDGETLYAVNSGSNSIAVIPLTGRKAHTVSGLIPTAYEPHDVTFSADGSWMYIISGKSVTGPNPGHLASSTGQHHQHHLSGRQRRRRRRARERRTSTSSSWSGPRWSARRCRRRRDLRDLTERVAKNNFYSTETDERDAKVMRFLSRRIKHVIYVVKENRTFDQMLGDLTNGAKVDPSLTQFGQALTPNNHKLATAVRHARQLHEPGRRQHGRLVVGDAGARHQHRIDHAADQLRGRQPRPVL